MVSIDSVIKWLWQLWPLWVILLIWIVYYYLLYYFPPVSVNKWTSFAAQLVGAFIFLTPIIQNFKKIQQKTIKEVILNYLNDFPLLPKNTSYQGKDTGISAPDQNLMFTIKKTTNSQRVEDKIDFLQEQINDLILNFQREAKNQNEKIDNLSTKWCQQLQDTKGKIDSIMGNIFTKGIKLQVFGMFLMIFGEGVSFFADQPISGSQMEIGKPTTIELPAIHPANGLFPDKNGW